MERLRRREEAETGRRKQLLDAAKVQRRRDILAAEKEADMARMTAARQVQRAHSRAMEQAVAVQTMISQQKALADAEAARLQQTARSMRVMLSPAYLHLRQAECSMARTQVYLGTGIPRAMVIEDAGPQGVGRGVRKSDQESLSRG